ncbi:hypothetical protein MNBD_NITROSPIRAE01-1498 [hydrothermal vent metagenome]|uniref:DUF4124 domain-containing protein n=1 Tax=hydrothermal vent metagenome TaxID=652676 RepID=A0A3B1CN98_9ZZZZ
MIFNEKLNMDLLPKMVRVFICLAVLFFSSQVLAQSEIFYKYVDKNGTVVITQSLKDVPKDQREKMEEVNFEIKDAAEKISEQTTKSASEVEALGEEQKEALKEFVTEENIKAVGAEAVRQGKDVFASFIEDQKTSLIVYVVAGIAGFFIFSKLLKRFTGGFVTKIVMKFAVVIVIFSGIYLLYLSWLSKTVLNFNPSGDLSEKSLVDQMTTPGEILQQTQDVVDQFNSNTKQREALLNGMDGS